MLRNVPVEPFPPGEYISDELNARGWTQEDLAEITGISRRQIINLVSGKSGITAETAHALAQAFSQEAKTWMELQMAYELALAAREDRQTARRAKIYEKLPVRDLKKRGWLPDVGDATELESAVCKLLSVSSIDETPQFAMAARKSTSYDYDTPAQIAWYARAMQIAPSAPATTYAPGRIETCIAELRKLAGYPEDIRKVPKTLADFGIRLLLIEHLPKSKIDGVAFWINDNTSPVIALSLRYDRIDNFWHVLMHEIVHIKHHDEPNVDVDLTVSQAGTELPEIENRANSEASNYLIENDRFDSFIKRHGRVCYASDIDRFAQLVKIHPGIIVGQLHGRKALDFKFHRKMLVKVRSEIIGQAITDGWGNFPMI